MSKAKEFGVASSGIATKAELDQRIAARPKPRIELHLTPPGHDAADVRRKLNEAAEKRIRHLSERLANARTGFQKGHKAAQLRGKAKHDFDRGR